MTLHERELLARLYEAVSADPDALPDALRQATDLLTPLDELMRCSRCCKPLGNEPVVTTTYDDVPPNTDTEPGELVGVHERCAA